MSTYEPIASQTLGSAAASVTFSSIPQGYTDLVLVTQISVSSGNANVRLIFNADSGANYSDTVLSGNGTAASSIRDTSASVLPLDNVGYASANFNNNKIISIMNYSNATTYKTVLIRSNNAATGTDAGVGLWRSTSAITSIEISPAASTFASGSTFSIYGIQVGDKAQKAQGGNIVTTDGTYVYHAFTSSGSFIPSQGLSADVLVIAGGGGGGSLYGGGGGAGGVIGFASQSLTSKSYTVTVGAGGAGVPADFSGITGSNSQFASLTAANGGGYGAYLGTGGNGGSGGGGAGVSAQNGGTGSQGSNGGNGSDAGGGNASGGGGGGATGAGANGTTSGTIKGGNGGTGTNSVTNWGSLSAVLSSINLGVSGYLAGGGGGGTGTGSGAISSTGGSGGGGNGGNNGSSPAVPTAGTVNTGSGGGGGGRTSPQNIGAAGGSGIVIIRYAI